MRLGAVVITCNEERNIVRCLSSLKFCDEVVVVDGGSTDGSVEILNRYSRWIDRWVSESDGGGPSETVRTKSNEPACTDVPRIQASVPVSLLSRTIPLGSPVTDQL